MLKTSGLRNQQLGLYFYGTTASSFVSFPGGWLCVDPPLSRLPALSTGGTSAPATDCSGELRVDFNAWASSGLDPSLFAGQSVWCQAWIRDPDLPSQSHSSNGLQFLLTP